MHPEALPPSAKLQARAVLGLLGCWAAGLQCGPYRRDDECASCKTSSGREQMCLGLLQSAGSCPQGLCVLTSVTFHILGHRIPFYQGGIREEDLP